MTARRKCIWLGTGVLVAIAAGGCQRSLFVNNQPRTQFDNYQRMRQIYIPVEEADVFGNPQPALRARLGQRGGG